MTTLAYLIPEVDSADQCLNFCDDIRQNVSDTDQLKQVLIESRAQLSQDTRNWAIDQMSKRLTIKAKGGHVEFRLD